MYILEWHDQQGDPHQWAFDSRERAERAAKYLERFYRHVAMTVEVTV